VAVLVGLLAKKDAALGLLPYPLFVGEFCVLKAHMQQLGTAARKNNRIILILDCN
jgi:hypothetical protein